MLGVYRPSEPNGRSVALARKITALVVDSAVTFKEATDALEKAQDMLMCEMYPVRRPYDVR